MAASVIPKAHWFKSLHPVASTSNLSVHRRLERVVRAVLPLGHVSRPSPMPGRSLPPSLCMAQLPRIRTTDVPVGAQTAWLVAHGRVFQWRRADGRPARSALPCRWTVRGNRSFRKEERDREAEPPIGSALRALRVIASAELELDRQPSDLHELAHGHVDGDRPLAVLPVVGGLLAVSRGPFSSAGNVRDAIRTCATSGSGQSAIGATIGSSSSGLNGSI